MFWQPLQPSEPRLAFATRCRYGKQVTSVLEETTAVAKVSTVDNKKFELMRMKHMTASV